MRLADASEENMLTPLFKLYETAFPAEEKIAKNELLMRYQQGQCQILSISDQERFVGLAILFFCKDTSFLAYLAIEPSCRGRGYGSQTLKQLQANYPNLILEIESTYRPQSQNYYQRKQRKAFYLKNNLRTLNYTVSCYGVEMELMTTIPNFRYQHYVNIYHQIFGLKETRQNIRLQRILLPAQLHA